MNEQLQANNDNDKPETQEFMDNDSISALDEIKNSLVISDCGSIQGSVRISDRVAIMTRIFSSLNDSNTDILD